MCCIAKFPFSLTVSLFRFRGYFAAILFEIYLIPAAIVVVLCFCSKTADLESAPLHVRVGRGSGKVLRKLDVVLGATKIS